MIEDNNVEIEAIIEDDSIVLETDLDQRGERGPQGEIGPVGPPGPTNTLTIGNVTKGDEASASITGTSPNQELNLVLPKGDSGPQGEIGPVGPPGPTNTLTIGRVTKGDEASASITGTSPNQKLNLVLPKGDPGPQGATGEKPTKGIDYFTEDDIEDLNINRIEKYILLSDMSDTPPKEISLNDRYYNTSSKLIFTAIDESHWSDFSESPKKNVFYINIKDGAIYYWDGINMTLITPNTSVYIGTCTDEELEAAIAESN